MKLRYAIISLAAAVLAFAGCQKETENVLSAIKVSSSYVGIPVEGGSTDIKLTATDSWEFEEWVVEDKDGKKQNEWLTIEPKSGIAGETTVKFSAPEALDGRTLSVKVTCAGQTQIINVIQGLSTVSEVTCAEVLSGIQGKTYRVTGICTRIAETATYGNWYINDGTGEVYVYGTKYEGKTKQAALEKLGVNVGDELTIEGPMTNYNGTIELVDVDIINHNKSLIKVDSLTVGGVKCTELPVEGGEIVAHLTCKGNGVKASVPADAASWLSLASVDGNLVTFRAAANDGGDRGTTLTFGTTDGKKDYSAQVAMTQKGSIAEVSAAEFNAKADGTAQYRISGIVKSIAGETDKYGTNLYIKDATGEVYIYGTVGEDGKAVKLSTLGVEAGDIVEFVGPKGSFNNAPQMKNGAFQWKKDVTAKKANEVAALADDDKNDPKNYILLKGVVTTAANGNKTDVANYGNFDLVDETGAIYVCGVSTGWKGETKKFSTLGVALGDEISIIAYKTSFNGKAQVVGMYVSHTKASSGEGGGEEGGSSKSISISKSTISGFTWGVTAYGDQATATISTYLSWTISGVGFTGCRLCLPDASGDYEKQNAIQGQGNASDNAKVCRLGNTSAIGKIKKITVVTYNSSTNSPNFNLATGSAQVVGTSIPSTMVNAADMTTTQETVGSIVKYTTTYSVTGDPAYFAIYKNTAGVLYLGEIKVDYE